MIMKIDTKILLTIISVMDMVYGSHGGVTLLLWIGYGIYKPG